MATILSSDLHLSIITGTTKLATLVYQFTLPTTQMYQFSVIRQASHGTTQSTLKKEKDLSTNCQILYKWTDQNFCKEV